MKFLFCLFTVSLFLNSLLFSQELNESFTQETFPPQGWTVHNYGVPQNNWARSTLSSNYHSPPAGARVFIAVNTPPFNEWLITPRLDLTASADTDTLNCWVKTQGTFASGEKLTIRLSTTNTDTASFTNLLYEIASPTSGWLELHLPLDTYESENSVYIAFHAQLSWTSYRAAVDDISGPPLYTQSLDVGATQLSISSLPLRVAKPDTFVGTFKNFGASTVNSLYAYFQVSGAQSVLDSVLIDSLAPQQQTSKEFFWTPDSAGKVRLSVYTHLTGDNNTSNDSVTHKEKVYQTFAIYESFEGDFSPADWTRLNYGTAPNKSWNKIAFAPYHGQYAAVCPYDITSTRSDEKFNEWLITPHLYCSQDTGDTLQFYFRRGNPSPFYLAVRVSTTDMDTASFTDIILEIPDTVQTSLWLPYKIPLDNYDGNSVYLAFQYRNDLPDNSPIQLDKVTAPPLYFSPNDVGVDSIIVPGDSTIVSDSLQPRALVRNFGEEIRTFKVKCEIDLPGQSGGNEFLDSLTVSNLAPHSSQEVLFSQWLPSDFNEQKYLVWIYSILSGDEYPHNDSLLSTVWTDDNPPINDNFASAHFIADNFFQDTSYTLGMTNDYDFYGTVPWQETGPEVVYALVNNQSIDTLRGNISQMSQELDIFLLNDPDPQSLVAFGSSAFIHTNALPDTYYIVIDGFQGAVEPPGSFVLEVYRGNPVGINPKPERKPVAYELKPNYPNPFNSETLIHYSVPKAVNVTLNIYDVRGVLVNDLLKGPKKAGRYSIRWNGCDNQGRPVATGVYILQMKTGDFTKSRKIMLIR